MRVYQDRFNAVVALGESLRTYVAMQKNSDALSPVHKALDKAVGLAQHKNGWFTRDHVMYALESWGSVLTKVSLETWLAPYKKLLPTKNIPTLFMIMAGNIPLVGFHDFLTGYLAGAHLKIKASSNDQVLLPWCIEFLVHHTQAPKTEIQFLERITGSYDALIATGSDNTARYFEYYFGHKPHIIRKNRNSVAVLTGTETKEELFALGEDIFRYYGLGCRSVSKVYVPKDYNFNTFFNAIFPYKDHIHYKKYSNNYDYNKAVYLMSEFKLLENGFLILKEDASYSSPIASLFYETYDSLENLNLKLKEDEDKIQCIVSSLGIENELAFGATQRPELHDYADGVDTVDFLLKTSQN